MVPYQDVLSLQRSEAFSTPHRVKYAERYGELKDQKTNRSTEYDASHPTTVITSVVS